jgi:molecular chaperone HtpG
MHPISRFGIGVMSYFMLADEIEVTTCRMDQRGAPGPVMRMTVLGPGQTARISRIQAQGHHPGTRVRLFLRDGQETPSCVDVLQRLLGVADYRTTARHGTRSAVWEPHEWTEQTAPRHAQALGVRGKLKPTLAGQVVWCESGGALLVDGLLVQPSVRHGVLADSHGAYGLHGAVINLFGSSAPALSVSRNHIVGDVSAEVDLLVTSAARELVVNGRDFLADDWLESLTRHSPRLATIVMRAASET